MIMMIMMIMKFMGMMMMMVIIMIFIDNDDFYGKKGEDGRRKVSR